MELCCCRFVVIGMFNVGGVKKRSHDVERGPMEMHARRGSHGIRGLPLNKTMHTI